MKRLALSLVFATCTLGPRPSVNEVEALLTAGYVRPQLHRLTVLDEEADAQTFLRLYDGVPLLGETKAVFAGEHWQLLAPRELHEPSPVDLAKLLSLERAMAASGSSSGALGRVVYVPVDAQKHYRLAWELTELTGAETFVDAYSGELFRVSARGRAPLAPSSATRRE